MKTARLKFFFLLALLMLAVGGLWYLKQPPVLQVQAIQVAAGRVEQTVSNTRAGSVKACRRARLSTATGGQIAELPVSEGDRVKKGALLLSLWNKDLKAQLALHEAQILAEQSKRHAACLQAEVARREADRLKRLRSSGAASEENIDKTEIEALARQAACEAADAAVMVAKAQSAVAAANIERTELYAPFDGIVADIQGEISEYTTPSPPGIPTPPAIDLIDNSCFYVSAPIDEVDAAHVRLGQPVRISLDAFREHAFNGEVRRIASYVLDLEKQARTVEIEAVFTDSPIEPLLAGYSADVEILLATREAAVRIPTTALVGENRVWVYDPAEQSIHSREIRIGLSNWHYSEVTNGLQPGEWLVTSTDIDNLLDGTSARLASPSP